MRDVRGALVTRAPQAGEGASAPHPCEALRSPLRQRCSAPATCVVENAAGWELALCEDHADQIDWPVSEDLTLSNLAAWRESVGVRS